ncbi:hypothetical protein FJZ39_03525 [Candidatus Saccharibacteria bacterium]|nr:hypothetical protein [Candidatus Saccharibacteria bacterium]
MSTTISIDILHVAMKDFGYSVDVFTLDGRKYTRFKHASGKSWLTRNGLVSYPFVTSSAHTVSQNKQRAYSLAGEVGVCYPATHVIDTRVTNADKVAIERMIDSFGGVIVKPENASGARGFTAGIKSINNLEEAVTKAYSNGHTPLVLVQEAVDAEEIRFAVVDGKVVSALLRKRPYVVGDGHSTVAELIAKENDSRRTFKMPYVTYPDLDETMLNPDTISSQEILNMNRELTIGSGTMIKNGASIINVFENVHDSLIEKVQRISNQIGHGFVVVDMFVKDYTQPAESGNYWFNEFNFSPSLKLHYSCRDGNHDDILACLIPYLDKTIANS